jgi:predicted RNase H-like HicB family nuclease
VANYETLLPTCHCYRLCLAKFDSDKAVYARYRKHDGSYIGRLKAMPAVMSQGEMLEQLQSMIRDAYQLMVEDAAENVFVPEEKQELSICL